MPVGAGGHGAPHIAGGSRVYVSQAGDGVFHARLRCHRLTRHSRAGVAWCLAREAHRSCLRACTTCAEELAAALARELGSVPSGARAGLPLPKLSTLQPSQADDAGRIEESHIDRLPYGAPVGFDDPRFHSLSDVDWGTATYGQDPEEFLGSTTDDDNEWRGGRRYQD